MRKHVTLYALLILLPTSGAFTQETPEFNIGMGYAFVRAFRYDESLPRGFWFSMNYNLNDWIGITGDLSRASDRFGGHVLAAVAGPKFTFRILGRVEPFIRILAGSSIRKELYGDYWDSQGYFTVQPGGGVDVVLSTLVAVRAAIDYGVIFGTYESESQLRITAGLVIRLASKR